MSNVKCKLEVELDKTLVDNIQRYVELNQLEFNKTVNWFLETGYNVLVLGSFLSLKHGNAPTEPDIRNIDTQKEEKVVQIELKTPIEEPKIEEKQTEEVHIDTKQPSDKPKGIKITKKQS